MVDFPNVQAQGVQNQYSDPLDRFWNLYLLDADKEDVRLTERWKGDADGILIFTGLFSTTVGSFIIATYPDLQASAANQSAATLLVITQQLGQITQHLVSPGSPFSQSPLNLTALESFAVPPTAIRVNILWILSFFLSVFCALLATLVQQWSRTYIGDTQRRGTPRARGTIHSFLRAGVERFGFNHAVDAIITLLHISVLLFTSGFLVLMLDINDLVARTLLGALIVAITLYLIVTLLPMFFPDCPFSTPLTLAIRIIMKYPSAVAANIIKHKRGSLLEGDRIFDQWDWWYHFFKRLALPGRQHTFTLCRSESSYQRPAHVLNQMVASLDENDEILEFVTSLPHYLQSVSRLGFNVPDQLGSRFPHRECLPPFLDRLLQSFRTLYNPGLVLTSRKINQLTRLVLLANAAGVDHQDPRVIISPKGGWIDTHFGMRVRPHLTTHSSGRWWYLVHDRNPVVSFLSHCLLSSMYILGDYMGRKPIEDINFMDGLWDTLVEGYELHNDRLLSSLARGSQDFLVVYRLLFFIRVILHYATFPEDPVGKHQSIWLPILSGLRALTVKLDFGRVPNDAHTAIWRVLAVIGRDDLTPPVARAHEYRGDRLDYAAVFERYPVLEDVLSWLARTLTLRRSLEHIRRRKSTTAIVPVHDADSHSQFGDYERRGASELTRTYSYPKRRRSTEHLLALDKDPDIQRRLLASRRDRKSTQEIVPGGASRLRSDLPDAEQDMNTVEYGGLQRIKGWLEHRKLLGERESNLV